MQIRFFTTIIYIAYIAKYKLNNKIDHTINCENIINIKKTFKAKKIQKINKF